MWSKICMEVERDNNLFQKLRFELYDELGTYNISLNLGQIMIESEEGCYLRVFDHGQAGIKDSDRIIIGNLLLRSYYLVYDMSPLEFDQDYIQIALGAAADKNLIGDQQYNPESLAYKPNK